MKPAAPHRPCQSDRHSEERREDVTENRGGRFRSESVSVLDRHDLPPLVSQLDIADRLGVTRHAVKQWRRRHGDFPLPALYIDLGEKPVWVWSDVWAWALKRMKRMRAR